MATKIGAPPQTTKPNPTIRVRVTPDMTRQLGTIAESRMVPLSTVVRWAVAEYLDRNEQKETAR